MAADANPSAAACRAAIADSQFPFGTYATTSVPLTNANTELVGSHDPDGGGDTVQVNVVLSDGPVASVAV